LISLSTHTPWLWLAPLVVSLIAGFLLTPLAIRAANRLQIIDRPIGLKIHKLPTPLLGGMAVYIAFAIGAVLFLPFAGPVSGIIGGGAVAVAVGVLDDRFSLPPLVHLGGQILAALVAVAAGVGVVKKISNPLASTYAIAFQHGSWSVPTILGLLFTVFWLVGMMNTINFLDGLDGLSSGVGAIAAIMLAWWAVTHHVTAFHHADLVLPIILAGALLGFLPFNWSPARIFIGDSGAMFVGLALGGMSIFGTPKIGTALLVLTIPVLDVAWAILRRLLHGRSFLTGDKQHVYHRMIELGLSRQVTVVLLFALCIMLGVLQLSFSRRDKLIAWLVVAVITGLAFLILEVRGNRRQPAATSASLRQ
jgi:UDP-GlcNAc:undecaprenyl-phosphate/decaprenyl-phosphate GlcNAc-1-phosphate transferase